MSDKIESYLEEKDIVYKKIIFCRPLHTVSEVSKALNIEEAQVVKTMLIKNDRNEYFGVILAGDKSVDFDWLKENFDQKKLSKDKSTTPVQLVEKNIKSIFDKSLLKYDIVNITSNDYDLSYELDPKDLYEAIFSILV